MSMMFRPPTVTTEPIGWAQVFGFRQDGDAFFGRVRSAQLASLNRFVPFNVALMSVNVLALLYTLRTIADFAFLTRWGLVMGGLALLWSARFLRVQQRGIAEAVTATTVLDDHCRSRRLRRLLGGDGAASAAAGRW